MLKLPDWAHLLKRLISCQACKEIVEGAERVAEKAAEAASAAQWASWQSMWSEEWGGTICFK